MNEHAIRKMLEGGGGVTGAILRTSLWLPGRAYGWCMQLRRMAYQHGWVTSRRVDVPVISIGNLTAGGSGKTPFTVFLAQAFLAQGLRPAILMRGYRQKEGISDEAALYQTHVPAAILEVNPNRQEGAARAISRGAEVILLDDGLQHLKLQRNVDIVLVDATSPWGGGNTLPGGLLREPVTTLRIAQIVVVTRADQIPGQRLEELLEQIHIQAPQAHVFTARHRPTRLLHLDGSTLPLQELSGKKVVALAGIARPEAFKATLESLGAEVVGLFAGRDHAHFTTAFLDSAMRAAENAQAMVIMTEKDRAKEIFRDLAKKMADKVNKGNNPIILTLGIEQEVTNAEALISSIADKIQLPVKIDSR